MTPGELAASIEAVFGTHKGRVADAARSFGVNPDNLRHMLAGRRPIPPGIAADAQRRVLLRGVAPPPRDTAQSDDRDAECDDALEPHLDDLARRAVEVGWHPAEVMAAAVTWAVQRAADHAGPDAARELLEQAREIVPGTAETADAGAG